MSTLYQQLDDLRAKHSAEIEALQEQIKQQEQGPWNPMHGPIVMGSNGNCFAAQLPTNGVIKAGRTFATMEQAEKASEFFTFYQRYYSLAMECNARHEADGESWSGVYLSVGEWIAYEINYRNCPMVVFTSISAAEEAEKIMNRDGWKLPAL